MNTKMFTEQGQDFAARYWGGPSVTARTSPKTYGRRDIDGGRPTYPKGWAFEADGFVYRVWFEGARYQNGHGWVDAWQMSASDGAFAIFWRDGDNWVVTNYYNTHTVPARIVVE